MTAVRIYCLAVLLLGCDSSKKISEQYDQEVSAFATKTNDELPYLVGKDFRPEWDIKNHKPREMGKFRFTNQAGKIISTENTAGKVAVVSFFYSQCPGICPMTTKNLKDVQKKFLKDDRIAMVSLSLTPEHDSPKVLKKFAERYKINSTRWHLLTGTRSEIYKLARESFDADTFSKLENARQPVDENDFLHSENVYLVDQNRKIRGVYSGLMPDSLQQMQTDIETLLQ